MIDIHNKYAATDKFISRVDNKPNQANIFGFIAAAASIFSAATGYKQYRQGRKAQEDANRAQEKAQMESEASASKEKSYNDRKRKYIVNKSRNSGGGLGFASNQGRKRLKKSA